MSTVGFHDGGQPVGNIAVDPGAFPLRTSEARS
jgi:hypothetical protein